MSETPSQNQAAQLSDSELTTLALEAGFWKGMTTDRYPDVEDGTLVCDIDNLRALLGAYLDRMRS